MGDPVRIDDITRALIAAGVTDPVALRTSVAIAAREAFGALSAQGNAAQLQQYLDGTVVRNSNVREDPATAATWQKNADPEMVGQGVFQYTPAQGHPNMSNWSLADQVQYFAQNQALQNNFQPWAYSPTFKDQITNPGSAAVQTAQASIQRVQAGQGLPPLSANIAASTGAPAQRVALPMTPSAPTAADKPAAPTVPAADAPRGPAGPNGEPGRTADEIQGTAYRSPEERTFFLQSRGITPPATPAAPQQQVQPASQPAPVASTVREGDAYSDPSGLDRYNFLRTRNYDTLGADAKQFLDTYQPDPFRVSGGRNAPRLGGGGATDESAPPPAANDGVARIRGPQADLGYTPAPITPSYMASGAQFGNQTTMGNAQAQAANTAVTGYQQQASQQAYNAAPAAQNAMANAVNEGGVQTPVTQWEPPNTPSLATGGTVVVGDGKARMKLAPTAVAGSPWPPPEGAPPPLLRVPEAVLGIGEKTGQVHFRIGDNPNGPETMTVTPPAGPLPPTAPPPGNMTSFRDGGQAKIGSVLNSGPSGGPLVPFPNDSSPIDGMPEALWRGIGWANTAGFQPRGTAQPIDASPTGDPRWLNLDKAPPLNEGIDTRIGATKAGLQGIGIDPRLADLAPMALTSNEGLKQRNAGAFYGSETGGPPAVTMPQTEWNVGSAVSRKGAMHEYLHALEATLSPQDQQRLSVIMQSNPVPPMFDKWHPGGITGYFDAWDGTGGEYQIPPAIQEFINSKVGSMQAQSAPPPVSYARGGRAKIGGGWGGGHRTPQTYSPAEVQQMAAGQQAMPMQDHTFADPGYNYGPGLLGGRGLAPMTSYARGGKALIGGGWGGGHRTPQTYSPVDWGAPSDGVGHDSLAPSMYGRVLPNSDLFPMGGDYSGQYGPALPNQPYYREPTYSYASGTNDWGTPYDPNYDAQGNYIGPGKPVATNTVPVSQPVSTYQQPQGQGIVAQPPVSAVAQASGGADPAQQALDARKAQIAAQQATIGPNQGVLDARAGVNTANQGYTTAQQGTIAPTQAGIAAQGNVINAQGSQTAGQRGYIGQEQTANAQATAEEQAIQAAHANIADQTAVARAQGVRDNQRFLYDLGGVAPPQEVSVPDGTQLPVGTVAKIRTQEQILTEKAAQADRLRQLQLQGAKLAVDLMGTDVAAAQQAAARVGLTLDQANLAVKQAGIGVSKAQDAEAVAQQGASQAGLDATAAGYAASAAGLAPRAGLELYTDPVTGASSYMTKKEADDLGYAYNKSQSAAHGQGSSDVPYSDMTVAQIQSYLATGQIREDDARAALQARNVPQATIDAVISRGNQRAAATGAATNEDPSTKGLSQSEIINGFLDGRIRPDPAMSALTTRIGLSPESALTVITKAIAARDAAAASKKPKTGAAADTALANFLKP